MKSKKIIIILIGIIILLAGLLVGKILKSNNKKQVSNNTNSINVQSQESTNNQKLSSEQKEIMNELYDKVASKNNTVKVIVNGEKITEKEIEFLDFQLNNKLVNKDGEKKDAVKEAIRRCIIVQDAQKRNIILTEEESKEIEENVRRDFVKGSEVTNQMLTAFEMEYEEFIKFYIEREKKIEIEQLWHSKISKDIHNEKLSIDNKLFKSKYEEFKKKKTAKLLSELVDIYTDYLQEQAIIEYMN